MIDPRHGLVTLPALIDWEVFMQDWSGFSPSGKARPAAPPRLVVWLPSLQPAYPLSDKAVVGRWVKNPYFGTSPARLSSRRRCRLIPHR